MRTTVEEQLRCFRSFSDGANIPSTQHDNWLGPERREREFIADFRLPIVDLDRAVRSTLTLCRIAICRTV